MLALVAKGLAAVRVQLPLALSDDSEPEPDLAVVPPGSYRDGHPRRALLVIEVADSPLRKDRREKGALYAEAGVPEYWIVDTTGERVEVHSEIVDGVYGRVMPHGRGSVIAALALPELRVAVDEIFG